MSTEEDIRDKVNIHSEDITGLNFIKDSGRYVFRKHYRQGLRSRIMEVLDGEDVRREAEGEVIDGIRSFPRARPLKMLRIFTNRFACLADVLEEGRMYEIIETYLSTDHIAASNEFIADYIRSGRHEIVLCGLQDYVEGEIMDPWSFFYKKHFAELCRTLRAKQHEAPARSLEDLVRKGRRSAESLIGRLKRMVLEAGYIPDLSGIGNLILTPAGNIKLVDINNISRVTFEDAIPTDDKGYPVCDKSIEVIAILEREVMGRPIDMNEPLYAKFLDPVRMENVKTQEEKFYKRQQQSP